MSLVKCNQVYALRSGNALKVKVGYNDTDGAEQNKKQKAKYANIPGLPSLDTPLMVDNVMTKDNRQLGNGQAAIIPPDVYLQFEIDFACQVGLVFSIEIQPQKTPITLGQVNNWDSVKDQNTWFSTSLAKFVNTGDSSTENKTIFVFDWKNYAKYNINEDVAEHSYQIKVNAWPIKQLKLPSGLTLSCTPNLAPPAVSDSFGATMGDSINVHRGTVTGGKNSTIGTGYERDLIDDKSLMVSCVFDLLVINDKYYSKHYYDIMQNNMALLDD